MQGKIECSRNDTALCNVMDGQFKINYNKNFQILNRTTNHKDYLQFKNDKFLRDGRN